MEKEKVERGKGKEKGTKVMVFIVAKVMQKEKETEKVVVEKEII
eukprot:CAMPEP_0114365950 /NCGR_PEP_ID=MMETSP0101-20121206/28849_1 /TAXON_ID=38822 ORGANISM="Pteridomonas danica, Strain PT" /NCGR_SAMPLE_ID=MMETSP0101 /ASSEMBLY_ACC=CAM_ASM_000211 /LENGTH=43 /DNA_ID= /DNA_START= /DNA_END= /DNA_ORIENTATION=